MTSNLPTLPAGWEWKKLENVCTLINGRAYKKEELLASGKYPVLRVGNFFTNNNWYYSDLELPENKYCDDGDLLYAWSASFGPKIWTGEKAIYHYHIWKILPQEKAILKEFLYILLGWDVEQIKASQGTGTTIMHVTKGSMEARLIPLPPLDEQKRLVNLLDTLFAKIDRSIELLSENITAADALLPSALNTVFTVEIVQEWEKYQFDKISKFIDYRGKTPTKTENGTILITAKNVRFGYLSDEPKEYIADADYEGWMTRGIPNQGDVIFTTEAPLGNVAILNTDEKRAFAQRIVTFQPISDVYDSNFLYWYMLSPIFQKELYDNATGTTVKGIKTAILKKFKIPLPPLDIQTQTVEYLDSIRTKVEILKQVQNDKIANLKALKASILDRAFKGEL